MMYLAVLAIYTECKGLNGVYCMKVLITWFKGTDEDRRKLLNVQPAGRILS